MDRDERAELVAMPHRTLVIVNEALARRNSHPQALAVDVLDLPVRGREYWLEDFLDHMVPPSPFALLVAALAKRTEHSGPAVVCRSHAVERSLQR